MQLTRPGSVLHGKMAKFSFVWSEVLDSTSNMMTAFWDVTHDKMETVSSSETLISTYHTTPCHKFARI
jgi:hypothetical protein